MKHGKVSDLHMASPGSTTPLKLADQRRLESSLSATKGISATYSERLADFQARRDKYWAENPPPHPHQRRGSRKQRENASASGARYEVSQDGCWVMEVFANAADMCFVTDRHVFNLWTYEQLRECDMFPWVSLNPPTQKQAYDRFEADERSEPCSLAESPSDQFFSMSSPNLHHNIGCHDEYDDDEPEPDYHCGCSKVVFHECHVNQANGSSQEVQVIRASRYADSFDNFGRHWVYVLPSSPLQSVLSRGLRLNKIPQPVIQRIWSLAVSWPAHNVDAVDAATKIVTMKVHPRWPFNMLRVRRHDRIVSIDEDKSSGEFWKLAQGMKAHFFECGFLVEDYQEDTEGFITKSYYQEGSVGMHDTLIR